MVTGHSPHMEAKWLSVLVAWNCVCVCCGWCAYL